MGLKYFCDRCGRELKSNNNSPGGIAIIRRVGTDFSQGFKGMSYLCDECAEKFIMVKDRLEHENDFFDMTDDDIALMEYDFKVGDVVITSTGETGIIESICDCDKCKKRGFYEPKATVINGDDTIYITDTDKGNGFISFYQIGKYKFGNIDKESVERSIEYEKNRADEAVQNTKKYMEQLKMLERLETLKDIKEDNNLDWLL